MDHDVPLMYPMVDKNVSVSGLSLVMFNVKYLNIFYVSSIFFILF